MRNTLKIGITLVVATALAMSGIALAQSDEDTTATTVPVQDRPGFAHLIDRLSPLVEAGTIDQTQAEAVAEALLGDGPRLRGHRFEAITVVADFFEMTPAELRVALADYESLADFADANGSSAEELIGILVDRVSTRLDQAVADGRLTDDQAAECLANATERITDMVSGDIEDRPFGGGPRFGHRPGS